MSMPAPAAGYYYTPTVDPAFLDMLKRQLAVQENLATAIREYLTFDLREQIASAEHPEIGKPAPFRPTDTMLLQAHGDAERSKKKLVGLQALIDEAGPMSEYLEAVLLPDIEAEVQRHEAYLSQLQLQMESTEPSEADVPLPSGSRRGQDEQTSKFESCHVPTSRP
jgi:hypothetical protein